MRNRNELNDLFRRNQYKLRERPDPRVWRRLEQRLDEPDRRIGNWVSRWSMAAAILLLVSVAFVLLQIVEVPQRAKQANANPQPTEIEDLPLSEQNAAVSLEKSLQLHREYERSTPIVEGEGKGRLVLNAKGKPTSSLLQRSAPRG